MPMAMSLRHKRRYLSEKPRNVCAGVAEEMVSMISVVTFLSLYVVGVLCIASAGMLSVSSYSPTRRLASTFCATESHSQEDVLESYYLPGPFPQAC